ncbi:MAG: flagellar biosynthesis protein FlhB [Oligoflexia bacterium]|nr:flagellar biosynthesis protein FlhB [Oligoflexia bacterium]
MADKEEGFEERSEQATQQRREDFRNAGQVAQSKEITSILIMFGIITVFYMFSRNLLGQVFELFNTAFTENVIRAARDGDIIAATKSSFLQGAQFLAPILGVTFVLAIGGSIAQIGFLAVWDQISPDIERINPISGFGKIFSRRNLAEGIKAVLKVVVVSIVAFLILKKEVVFTPQLAQMNAVQIFVYTMAVLGKLFLGVCALMAVLAIFDYAFQRWDLETRMKMTKQEVKEEYRQREGDPLIKSRIKRIQRDLAQKRMMNSVPKADVVITNPTHIAVALQYDRMAMAAPVVLAKGADLVAEKIKEIARKHQIPVVENKPLARTIFKTIKIGHPIPRALYNAVAEVLAYVYRLKGKLKKMSDQIQAESGGVA